jgi:ABC-type methionine transport system ATPase subunit
MASSLSDESLAALQVNDAVTLDNQDDTRPTQTRIRIRIPKSYHDEPVISRLISHYGLTVNITAALLGANARDDGWFDLELRGRSEQIRSALLYFNELDLEIWSGNTEDQHDGW